MTTRLLRIKFWILLLSVFLVSPVVLLAQTTDANNAFPGSTSNSKDSSEIALTDTSSNYLVNTAFKKVKKKDIIGGISVVNLPEILKKNYITNSLDGMSAYVGGFNGQLWGMGDYLVLVDGVPRDPGSVEPSSIDQITFLKGVSAVVLYGSRAANGAILITTKRGGNHQLQFDGRVNAGMFTPIEYPQYLGSATYMTFYNEARQNDGLSPLYDQATIYRYASGKDPYRYPNVDFYSPEYLKKFYNRYDADLEVSGGNKNARFYTNFNYTRMGSLLNFGQAKKDGSNHFSMRGNVDLNINKNLSGYVDVAAIYDLNKGVNTDFWGGTATLRPNSFIPLIPISRFSNGNTNLGKMMENNTHVIDGKYLLGGTQLYPTNPIADVYAAGSNEHINRQFQLNVGIDANLVKILKGLTFHSMFAVDYQAAYTEAFNNAYAVYEPVWATYSGINHIIDLTTYGKDSKTGNQNISGSTYNQTIAFSGQLNYDHTISEKHHISAMLIASGYQQSQAGVYHKTNNTNLGVQLDYNFRDKYYAEFNMAVPYSTKLPPGKRVAFSPAISLGWRINREGFLSNVSKIDNLKLSASAGILNTDLGISDYYLYDAVYTQANGEWFGWGDGRLRKVTDSRRGENDNLRYPQRKEINVTLDASFFKHLITFNGSFFYAEMHGIIIQDLLSYPSYFMTYYPNSSFVPYINHDINQRHGFDFKLNISKKIGNVKASLGIVGTYFDSRAIKRSENNQYAYQNKQGKPLDGIWGLQSLGFFNSDDDIAKSPEQTFGTAKPGDIKYKDQNGDGVINDQDVVYLGKAGWFGAPLTYGINLTINWKKLTLFALGTGNYGAYAMKNNSYYWISGDDKYSTVVLNRWTEKTKQTATYPRLTTQGGDNNYLASDFWMYSTNRFDIHQVQLTYDFSRHNANIGFFKNIQVYIRGENLLTISPNRKVLELTVGAPPQCRFYDIGINTNF